MRKYIIYLGVSLLFACFTSTFSACSSSKSGCPATDNAQVKMGKNGELPKGKGKSNLFPKSTRKKMRVN